MKYNPSFLMSITSGKTGNFMYLIFNLWNKKNQCQYMQEDVQVLYTQRAVINVWQVMKHEEKVNGNVKQYHVDRKKEDRKTEPATIRQLGEQIP